MFLVSVVLFPGVSQLSSAPSLQNTMDMCSAWTRVSRCESSQSKLSDTCLYCILLITLRYSLSLNQELAILTRVADQRVLGMCMPPQPHYVGIVGIYGYVQLLCVCWKFELMSLCLQRKCSYSLSHSPSHS